MWGPNRTFQFLTHKIRHFRFLGSTFMRGETPESTGKTAFNEPKQTMNKIDILKAGRAKEQSRSLSLTKQHKT